ncbi:hypothetical protein CSUI_000976 [Cystoisospora suis]|uniref:Uncharacterized protein n=1 Tax=Cystoisospora suis TaxID=483139 RepID=A0A2C6LC15_9APIC|nr:hypothetical protein CSUI_000976 [Cystoisospora suis]
MPVLFVGRPRGVPRQSRVLPDVTCRAFGVLSGLSYFSSCVFLQSLFLFLWYSCCESIFCLFSPAEAASDSASLSGGEVRHVRLFIETKDGRQFDLYNADNVQIQPASGSRDRLLIAPGGPGTSGGTVSPPQEKSMWRSVAHHAVSTVVASALLLGIGEVYSWWKSRRQEKRMAHLRKEVANEREQVAREMRRVKRRLAVFTGLGDRLTTSQRAEKLNLQDQLEDLKYQLRRNELKASQLYGFPLSSKPYQRTAAGNAGGQRSSLRYGEALEQDEEDERSTESEDTFRGTTKKRTIFDGGQAEEKNKATAADSTGDVAEDNEQEETQRRTETAQRTETSARVAGKSIPRGSQSYNKGRSPPQSSGTRQEQFTRRRASADQLRYIKQLLQEYPGVTPDEAIKMAAQVPLSGQQRASSRQ